MVGIVVVSHSSLVAEGIKEIAAEMAPEVDIECAGGTFDSSIGSDADKIWEAIEKAYTDDGVLVFFDIGSSRMNAEIAIEFLEDSKKNKVKIVNGPLVEGTLMAAVACNMNKNLDYIKDSIESM